MVRIPCVIFAAALLATPVAPALGQHRGACSLLDPEEASKAIGLPVVNVAEQDRGSFTSCSFETDDWTRTVGLIHFPGLAVTTPEVLAAELRSDMERDGMDYAEFIIKADLGAPAIYYRSPEGDLHTVVAQSGGDRVIVTAGAREAALVLTKSVLRALRE